MCGKMPRSGRFSLAHADMFSFQADALVSRRKYALNVGFRHADLVNTRRKLAFHFVDQCFIGLRWWKP